MKIHESGLHFEFNKEWVVLPYDKHRYYRAISGEGMRGVDLLGIYRGEQVFLFEIKHFRNPVAIGNKFTDHFLEHQVELGARICQKGMDTLKAIELIHSYLRKNWFFRQLESWYTTHRFQRSSADHWHFWARLYHLIFERGQWQYVLWLEMAPALALSLDGRVDSLQQALQEQVQQYWASPQPLDFQVYSIQKNPHQASMKVINKPPN